MVKIKINRVTQRCAYLREECVGRDAAIICRRQIAEREGFECPKEKKYSRWKPTWSCLNLEVLVKRQGAKKTTVPVESLFENVETTEAEA